MTRTELEQITKWLETNANASRFHNVYEMLERFRLEFNHLLEEEKTFNSGEWVTIQCLATDHKQTICASFVTNDRTASTKWLLR